MFYTLLPFDYRLTTCSWTSSPWFVTKRGPRTGDGSGTSVLRDVLQDTSVYRDGIHEIHVVKLVYYRRFIVDHDHDWNNELSSEVSPTIYTSFFRQFMGTPRWQFLVPTHTSLLTECPLSLLKVVGRSWWLTCKLVGVPLSICPNQSLQVRIYPESL